MKGYVLWRRDESSVVRRDREGDDRLRLVASLEDLVPLGAEIAGLVIDDDASDDVSAVASAGASIGAGDAPSEAPFSTDPSVDDRPLAPVVPLFSADRAARRRHR